MLVHLQSKGQTCGEECEIYSRCVGYHRPLKNWNSGKQEEFKDRKNYTFKIIFNEHGEPNVGRIAG